MIAEGEVNRYEGKASSHHIGSNDNGNIGGEFDEKLAELQNLQVLRQRVVEKKLHDRDCEIIVLKEKLKQIERDFAFNLNVIDERDVDIADLTKNMLALKGILEDKSNLISIFHGAICVPCLIAKHYFHYLFPGALRNENAEKDRLKQEGEHKFESERKVLFSRIEDFKVENKVLRLKLQERSEEVQLSFEQKNIIEKNFNEKLAAVVEQTKNEYVGRIQMLEDSLKKQHEAFEIETKRQVSIRYVHEQGIAVASEKIRSDNERLHNEINELKLSSLETTRKLSEEVQFQKQRCVESSIKAACLQRELDSQRVNLQIISKSKLDAVTTERDELAETLARKKEKYQRTLVEMRETSERKLTSTKEDHERTTRQLECSIRELKIDLERTLMNQGSLQAAASEKQRKLQKELDDFEEKFRVFRKAQENSLRSVMSDKTAAEFQLKLKQEELERVIEDREDARTELARVLEDAGSPQRIKKQQQQQTAKVRQNRQKFVNQQEKHSLFEEDQALANRSRQNNDSNSLAHTPARQQQQKQQQGEHYGQIESYEKLFSDDMGPASPPRNKGQGGFSLDFLSNNKSASFLVNSVLVKNKLQSQQLSSSVQLLNNPRQSTLYQQQRNIADNNSSKMQYESEIAAYKQIIETIATEMEGVNRKLQLSQSECQHALEENNELKHRISELQLDIMNYREKLMKSDFVQRVANEKDEELTTSENANKKIQAKVDKLQSDLIAVKKERDQLLRVAATLREKVEELQTEIFYDRSSLSQVKKKEEEEVEDSVYYAAVSAEPSIKLLPRDSRRSSHHSVSHRASLTPSKQVSLVENVSMRHESEQEYQSQQQFFSNNRSGKTSANNTGRRKTTGAVPKYDNFISIDDARRVESLSPPTREEYQLQVVSNSKPLADRQVKSIDHPTQKQLPQYIPNSMKATPSQKMQEARRSAQAQAEERQRSHQQLLQLHERDQSPKIRVMNYNTKQREESEGK